MALHRIAAAAAVAVALAAGCGRSGSGSQPTADVTPGGLTLLIAPTGAAPDAACWTGGAVVSAGLDADRDGVLDPAEIATSQTVCDAELGPLPWVFAGVATEPPGAHCAAGGTRVDIGHELDGDGDLDAFEVEQTVYVCSAATPDPSPAPTVTPAPVPGAAPVLARVDPETTGSFCPAGGSAVRIGADTSGDGALDPGEVTTVRHLCETAALPTFTIRSQADAELVAAAEVVAGNLVVEVAEPTALTLRANVVQGSISVHSGLTSLELSGRVIGGGLRVEANRNLRSFTMLAPESLGGSVFVQDNPELTRLGLPVGSTLADSAARRRPFRYPGSVVIRRNPKLETVGGSGASEVAGDLVLEANPRLALGPFLDGLTRVGGNLVLADTMIAELGFPPTSRSSGSAGPSTPGTMPA